MSENDMAKTHNRLFSILFVVVLILVINGVIDLYAGWRDVHHIIDLQRRVAELEQKR
jgi:capsule polysaccharide export protein KpsE/RkpR